MDYLNTSHVKVNKEKKVEQLSGFEDVKVNLSIFIVFVLCKFNLNTSHVKVNPLILSHFYIFIIPLKADYINFS